MSEIYPVLTQGYVFEDIFMKRTIACSANGDQIMLYFDERTRDAMITLTEQAISADLFAYKDENMTIEADTGWYFGSDTYSYFYQKGAGFASRTYCTPAVKIKVGISITVWSDGTWDLTANRTEFAIQSETIRIKGIGIGKQGGTQVASFPFEFTIPANQLTGTSSGWHNVDFPMNLQWEIGGIQILQGTMIPAEVNGFIGLGN